MKEETEKHIKKAYENGQQDFKLFGQNVNFYKEFVEPKQFIAYKMGFEHMKEFKTLVFKNNK